MGSLPNFRFETAWLLDGNAQGRIFRNADRRYMVTTAYLDMAETLIVVVPF